MCYGWSLVLYFLCVLCLASAAKKDVAHYLSVTDRVSFSHRVRNGSASSGGGTGPVLAWVMLWLGVFRVALLRALRYATLCYVT